MAEDFCLFVSIRKQLGTGLKRFKNWVTVEVQSLCCVPLCKGNKKGWLKGSQGGGMGEGG